MNDFEKTIKQIFHFVAEYGIQNKPLNFNNLKAISEKDKLEFLIQVHKGFRLGQELIVKTIIPLLQQLKELKSELKLNKGKQNKELVTELNSKINLTEYKIQLLRHFADFIAWQVFKKDYYKARRFYSGDTNRPDLLNTNLESVLIAVEHFHKEDNKSFALICDLTSFIDIGDILLIKDKEIQIVECKSGPVQKKVFDFLEYAGKDEFDVTKIDYSDKDEKFFKQAQRTLKQMEKGRRVTDFMKNEEGVDPFSDTKIKVLESTNPQEYFFEYIMQLIEDSKSNNSTYGELEDIIYIGIYRSKKMPVSSFLFKEIVNHIYDKNIVVDYMTLMDIPLKEPIFFKPFGVETIFDLMFGRLKIYLAINLDKLIELFNSKGIEAKWLNRKETHKILDSNRTHKPFTYKNQAIQIKLDGNQITLGDSFLIYLLLDNITPTSYVERFRNLKKGST